jgi:hypothetical protein
MGAVMDLCSDLRPPEALKADAARRFPGGGQDAGPEGERKRRSSLVQYAQGIDQDHALSQPVLIAK